jgi:hypothetical protein
MSQPTLVVMAAGIGSRYGGLKQMDPVGPNDQLIIDYSVYDALRAGFGRVVFVIREDIEEAFQARVGARIARHCPVAYVVQRLQDLPAGYELPIHREKPWGTGHAVLACREAVHSPFAVINADDFYGPAAFRLLSGFLGSVRGDRRPFPYCMVGFLLRNTVTEHGHVSRGVCRLDRDGYLVGVHERTHIRQFDDAIKYRTQDDEWVRLPADAVVSMNIWGFSPSLFPQFEMRFARFLTANRDRLGKAEFYLPEVVGDMVRDGVATVKVLSTPDRWFGVTYQEDKPFVEAGIGELTGRGVYPRDLWR